MLTTLAVGLLLFNIRITDLIKVFSEKRNLNIGADISISLRNKNFIDKYKYHHCLASPQWQLKPYQWRVALFHQAWSVWWNNERYFFSSFSLNYIVFWFMLFYTIYFSWKNTILWNRRLFLFIIYMIYPSMHVL